MNTFYTSKILYRQYPSRIDRQQQQQLKKNFGVPQISNLTIEYCKTLRQKGKTISISNLTNLLDKLFEHVNNIQDERQQTIDLKEILFTLIQTNRSNLSTVCQHEFFTLIQKPLINILQQWTMKSKFKDDDLFFFRNIAKLFKAQLRSIEDVNLYPSWISNLSLLQIIGLYLKRIITPKKGAHERILKNFRRFFNIYKNYQILIYESSTANQDQLIEFIDSIIECLTSNFYINSFDNLQKHVRKLSSKEKLVLIQCPQFFINYRGSRRDDVTRQLLSIMLPKYTALLGRLLPSVSLWKKPMIQAVEYLLLLVNHGSKNSDVLTSHLSFIDQILKLIQNPFFLNKLPNQLSNSEMQLIDTTILLLSNCISNSTVLTYIKEKKVTPCFLRYSSATEYETIVHNAHTLLAYTTSDDDIQSMQNPGILLSTVFNAFKHSIEDNNSSDNTQLLETLQGLIQHEQLKDEVLKQNMLTFLVQSTDKLAGTQLALLLKILCTLTFSSKIADVLRDNDDLKERVQEMSKQTDKEEVQKAADALVWKLVREPEFLNKVAQRQDEENHESSTSSTTTATGTSKSADGTQVEKIFPYDMMISYCHADKDLVKQIHQFLLDQGFKIWIDLNNMFGPAMSAMAEAVESSEFVLLCMSESYKNSTYCQAEAEYAFNCKRRLIPLIVRPKYRADGWLGFMIGTRIYIDYGSFDFPIACDKLIDEISRQRKRPHPSKIVKASGEKDKSAVVEQKSDEKVKESLTSLDVYKTRLPNSSFNWTNIYDWSESDVLDFLFMNKLYELMPLCEQMDGPAIIQLYKMCLARYNQAYDILNQQLKTTCKLFLPIGIYTKFLSLMEQKAKPPNPPIYLPALPPPIPRPALPPPLHQQSNSRYDIVVTSGAPLSQLLNMVERVGSKWQVKDSRY